MSRGLVLLALIAACGGDGADAADARADAPDAAGCGPETCSGCCAGTVCFGGDSALACGAGGAQCALCAPGDICGVTRACASLDDPCQGVAAEGACTSPTSRAYCATPTGGDPPQLVVETCGPGATCAGATCLLTGECSDGETHCDDPSTLRACSGGTWEIEDCTCVDGPIGAHCAFTGATQALSTSLLYELRLPSGDPPSDWGALTTAPGRGLLVVSGRYSSTGELLALVDSTTTDDTGAFTLQVPSAPTPDDYLVFHALGVSAGTIAYAVADPRLPTSATPSPLGSTGSAPTVWSWSVPVSSASGTVTIRDTAFSGPMHVFDVTRRVHTSLASRFPSVAPVVLWLAPGVSWTCGTCQWNVPTTRFGTTFATQVFLRTDADEQYWSDSVIAHELGHSVMATQGRSVGEGGRHCFGVATAPGLAWSEGYATWFSADLRGDPRYVDKQGSLFWFDISARDADGLPWPLPLAADGLTQDLYENEVAAMLWSLSQVLGRAPLDAALASPRMTVPPFERGYTRHTWQVVPSTCARTNLVDAGTTTTFIADFLDALVCGGASPAAIDSATDPTVRYPYPSDAPLCRPAP